VIGIYAIWVIDIYAIKFNSKIMKNRFYLLVLFFALLALAVLFRPSIVSFTTIISTLIPGPPESLDTHVFVIRVLPPQAYGGGVCQVNLSVVKGDKPPDSVTINEYVPAGWTIADSEPDYGYDPENGRITWVISANFTRMDLKYSLRVPTDASGTAEFTGEYAYDDPDTGIGVTEEVWGDTSVSIISETTSSIVTTSSIISETTSSIATTSSIISETTSSIATTSTTFTSTTIEIDTPPGPPGDLNGDGKITDSELLELISEWVEVVVGDLDLLDVIDIWSSE